MRKTSKSSGCCFVLSIASKSDWNYLLLHVTSWYRGSPLLLLSYDVTIHRRFGFEVFTSEIEVEWNSIFYAVNTSEINRQCRVTLYLLLKATCVSTRARLCPKNWRNPIARTTCLSAHQGYPKGLFSSEWTISGSANFYCFLNSIQGQTLACSTWTVPMFLCWKSTGVRGNQVILCIFCIFFIFLL